jgi:N-acetylglucosaminyl-diphospho-decaprenol L-rhamnosyltransferase
MTPPAVSAILVNYNAGEELREALASIASDLQGQAWEAFVIDNASADGSQAVVAQFAPEARLIQNASNVGFARGVNQGLAASSGQVVLIMNPDCRLERGAMSVLRAELSRHADCAIVGPQVLNPDGSLQGSARGDPDMLTGLFGRAQPLRRWLPWLPAARRNVITPDQVGRAPSISVDWISGACMLARREALLKVGGFDERYFMYWEDADLCRRLRAIGCHARYAPGATAVHQVGRSSGTARRSSVRAFHRSAYLYYATHVAPGVLDPKRWIARVVLGVRCWLQLRNNPAD